MKMKWLWITLILVSCATKETTDVKPEILVTPAGGTAGTEPNTPHQPTTGAYIPKPGDKFLIHTDDDCSDVKSDYDVIFFDPGIDKNCIERFKAKGILVGGYMSVGSWESGRTDSDALAPYELSKMKGWPEYWLDVSKPQVLEIMKKRIDHLKSLGFTLLYSDNSDIMNHEDKITRAINLKYLKDIYAYAHSVGLLAGPNNAIELVADLKDDADFFVNEQCLEYGSGPIRECSYYSSIAGTKAIFHLEYSAKYCKPVPGHSVALVSGLSQSQFKQWCGTTIETPKPTVIPPANKTLPDGIPEASGIAYSPVKKEFYVINDSGNSGDLFVLDEQFKLKQKVKTGLKNIDFEAVAYSDGKIYIADIGSNDESRSSKIVYVLNEIDFKLIETIKIPMTKDFNAEGLAVWNGDIFILEKNYEDEPNGIWKFSNGKLTQYTQLVMPKGLGSLGDMSVNSRGEFIFPAVGKGDGVAWIWSAGKLKKLSIEKLGQTESMTWVGDDSFVYATEGDNGEIVKGQR